MKLANILDILWPSYRILEGLPFCNVFSFWVPLKLMYCQILLFRHNECGQLGDALITRRKNVLAGIRILLRKRTPLC